MNVILSVVLTVNYCVISNALFLTSDNITHELKRFSDAARNFITKIRDRRDFATDGRFVCHLGIHKVSNVGIFLLVKFENKMDREISHLNYNSKHMTNVNLLLNWLFCQLFTIYLHKKLYKIANIANFVYYGKIHKSHVSRNYLLNRFCRVYTFSQWKVLISYFLQNESWCIVNHLRSSGEKVIFRSDLRSDFRPDIFWMSHQFTFFTHHLR